MNIWQYEVRSEITVAAPVEKAYAVAVDPSLVPSYVPEVQKLEVLEKLPNNQERVRSHIRIAGWTKSYLYRYTYRPPHSKTGIQEDSALYSTFFTLSFRPENGRTVIVHTEGIKSRVPGLAPLMGILYFRFLAPRGTDEELRLFKKLVERS